MSTERDALIRFYGIMVDQFDQANTVQIGGPGLVTLQAATETRNLRMSPSR